MVVVLLVVVVDEVVVVLDDVVVVVLVVVYSMKGHIDKNDPPVPPVPKIDILEYGDGFTTVTTIPAPPVKFIFWYTLFPSNVNPQLSATINVGIDSFERPLLTTNLNIC